MAPTIEAHGLVKRYKEVVALDGLDLAVEQGTILAVLGPNGAGKTTAVSILTTLLKADEGTATVAGFDVRDHPDEVKKNIGLSGQFAAVDEQLTGFENLRMVGRLYRMGKPAAVRRSRELLEQFDLTEAADRPVKGYSGGMRRRLDLAGALIAEPPILFLDEPTTGLDPRSRADLWIAIKDLVAKGTTLLLTTQYMEEAEHLADDIMVIDHGKEIAHGNADELKTMIGGERVVVTVSHADDVVRATDLLAQFAVGEQYIEDHTREITVPISGGAPVLTAALRALDVAGVEISDVGLRRPTLDDVFLTLTGHRTEETNSESAEVRT
ncbi:MAG: ATP-binding cassette domain-containing protein [Acidimicrobiia bacterium]|nr:ATP-binding cassette domain-containing protein [Acidimicrobiia bacterium]MDH5421740.1 ATP-binding cassette domain-containing protein [Acidimicrobiia bacterium]MDH5504028.1 ATP-binding cassette domain-containing protein [Acidimicrobiia bacterium]